MRHALAAGTVRLQVVAHKRLLNSAIRECFPEAAHPIAFVCECGAVGCSDVVWLPGDAYDSCRADPRWAAIAPGHFVVPFEEAA
jgi:hypothetical protein